MRRPWKRFSFLSFSCAPPGRLEARAVKVFRGLPWCRTRINTTFGSGIFARVRGNCAAGLAGAGFPLVEIHYHYTAFTATTW